MALIRALFICNFWYVRKGASIRPSAMAPSGPLPREGVVNDMSFGEGMRNVGTPLPPPRQMVD